GGTAADDRKEIDQAGGGEPARDHRHVLRPEAAGAELVSRDAGAHDEVAAGPPSDLRQHLEAEAQAVVQAAAVLVQPLVEDRRPELSDEMVVRHRDLDAVQPSLATAPRRLTERPDELGDLLGVQRVWDLAMDALGDLRGRQQRARNVGVGLRTPSEVRELREDQTI